MFVKRQLQSGAVTPLLLPALLSRQHIHGFVQAEAVRAEAQVQAEAGMHAQVAQANQAQADFLRRALACSESWDRAHQQHQQSYQETAVHLVNKALRLLLSKIPTAERIEGLLMQLFDECPSGPSLQVCCHPAVQDQVQHWLNHQTNCTWILSIDSALAEDALYLVMEGGELHLNWNDCIAQLLLPEAV
ncbi:HrpE/YscL family type III secretion apparatus protein [Pseudomonas yamanorum]|uniref:HrpE/YscL family type III secretion apparatus protein n=1 Tax=Pseudomonas yamanorum TaxID=515393 RepID=UPI0012FDC5FA|nr:HrpE/YscL family type III secretion apparatus protein [Pseudomonas yamanorum]